MPVGEDGEVAAVIARFGLDGVSDTAHDSRSSAGRRRQATSDAINRPIRVVAADLSMQPLMPLPTPALDLARCQVIVESVSLINGPPLRPTCECGELLSDPTFPVAAAGASERQQRHRLVNGLAITSDHLDRDQISWSSFPQATADGHRGFEDWHRARANTAPPSVGAMRALVTGGETSRSTRPATPRHVGAASWMATGHSSSCCGWRRGRRPLANRRRGARWTRIEPPPGRRR